VCSARSRRSPLCAGLAGPVWPCASCGSSQGAEGEAGPPDPGRKRNAQGNAQPRSCSITVALPCVGILFAPGRVTAMQSEHEPDRPAAAHLSGADRDGGGQAPGQANPGCRRQGCSQRQAGRPGQARAGALAAGLQAARTAGQGRARAWAPQAGPVMGEGVGLGHPWASQAGPGRAERGCRVCASDAPSRGAHGARARLPGLLGAAPGMSAFQGTLLSDTGHG